MAGAFGLPRVGSTALRAGKSIERVSVTVPTNIATDITMALEAPVPRDTFPAIAVSEIQRVDMASVLPEVTWPE